jgi:hypothetical protein
MNQKEMPKIINLTGADIEYAGVKIPAHEQDVGFTMLDGDPVTPVKIGSWGKNLVFLSGGVIDASRPIDRELTMKGDVYILPRDAKWGINRENLDILGIPVDAKVMIRTLDVKYTFAEIKV